LGDRGRFIVFEGIEGAGKSTQIASAAQALRRRGRHVVETREPGGTPLGVEIRRLLMHLPETVPTPLAELLLYLADRAQHLSDVIRPGLAAGHVVLSDRFSASTIAYQGYARQLDLDTVLHLDRLVRAGVWPDLTVVLDCPVEIGLRRARGDDRFHREEADFHERVRAAFLELAARDPVRHCVVDATAPAVIVRSRVLEAVERCLSTA
jgi:dTMP kinase